MKGRRPGGEDWPILLRQKLPPIKVPLRAGEAEIHLDLQALFQIVYDRAGYDLIIDYRAEPDPPLTPEQAQWAHALLKAKGLR